MNTAAKAFQSVSEFTFSLKEVDRWQKTAFLIPSPQDPFIRLTEAIAESFPDYPPYSGMHADIIPHLTFADGNELNADIAEKEIKTLLAKSGAITSKCSEIELLENSSGQWKTMDFITLPS